MATIKITTLYVPRIQDNLAQLAIKRNKTLKQIAIKLGRVNQVTQEILYAMIENDLTDIFLYETYVKGDERT